MREGGRHPIRAARLFGSGSAMGLAIALAMGLAMGLSIAPAVQAAKAADFDCDGLLRMHGLLRSAARVCGFSRYNEAIVARARSCYETLGSTQGARDLYTGADEFTALATSRGQDALCPYLLRRFPMVVRP